MVDFALGKAQALPAPRDFPTPCQPGSRCLASLRASFKPVAAEFQRLGEATVPGAYIDAASSRFLTYII